MSSVGETNVGREDKEEEGGGETSNVESLARGLGMERMRMEKEKGKSEACWQKGMEAEPRLLE